MENRNHLIHPLIEGIIYENSYQKLVALKLASAHLQRGDIDSLGHVLNSINVLNLEDKEKSKYFYLKAIYFYDTGNVDEAIVNFQRSRVILSELGDFDGVIQCLLSIAMCFEMKNDYESAARIQESMLGYMESKFSDRGLISQVLGDLAINYARLENYVKVLPLLERAYKIAELENDMIQKLIIIRKFVEYYDVLGDEIQVEHYERIESEMLESINNSF